MAIDKNVGGGVDRSKLKDSDFAGKNRSYPIVTEGDVSDALQSIGRAGSDNYDAATLKRNILKIAKRKGFKIPASDTKEATVAAFVGRIDLDAAVDGQPRTSWAQFGKTGKFWDARYGEFSITQDDIAQIVENFKNVTPKSPTEMSVDYNHASSKPTTTPDTGRAAGWVKDLQVRDGGKELWAQVEWTAPAAGMIEAKEYRYISPRFAFNHKHSNGKNIGTTLMNAALTINPFLDGMQPVTLSLSRYCHELDDASSPGNDAMFSYDEQRRRVQAALSLMFGEDDGDGLGMCAGIYLVDLFDGRAIYREYDGGTFEVPFTIGDDGVVTFTNVPQEVVSDWKALDDGSDSGDYVDTGATEMSNVTNFKTKDASGKDVELSAASVAAVLAAHAPKPGTVVEMAKFTELQTQVAAQDAKITELTTANETLVKERRQAAAESKVDKLLRDGKITRAQRPGFVELAMSNETTFDTIAAGLQVVTKYDATVGSDAATGGNVQAQIEAAVAEQKKANPNATPEVLYDMAMRANPALYELAQKQ